MTGSSYSYSNQASFVESIWYIMDLAINDGFLILIRQMLSQVYTVGPYTIKQQVVNVDVIIMDFFKATFYHLEGLRKIVKTSSG
jgi:hypothetical protein